MIVYDETKKQFLLDTYNDEIEKKIEEQVKHYLHRNTGNSEIQSWMNSMQYMYKVILDNRIPDDSNIAIEYRIPNSNKRVDFIVSGSDHEDNEIAVIIELKQWQKVEKVTNKDSIIKTILGGKNVEVAHPSYQAWSYVSLIKDYNSNVTKYAIKLKSCAYLHNYTLKANDDLNDICYKSCIDMSPIFTRGDVNKLSSFIAKYIKKANPKVLYHIENGDIIPSKSLQDNMNSMLKGNKEFTLIDEQKVIFEKALSIVQNNSKRKSVYIIHGGPGTGKSVLAINMLVEILNYSKNVMYITKNVAPREVYKKKLINGDYRRAYVDNLFKGSGDFTETDRDVFDCLIVDEAHRLNAKSGMYQNKGENQIKEIINSSKTSIFFVDNNQMVTTKDIGDSDEIKKWCEYYKVELYEDSLLSQFRCNGSDSYIQWVDSVLQINNIEFKGFDADYDIRIMDSPNEVKKIIEKKNIENNKARMVAGYCWDWKKEGKSNNQISDIAIGDFEMSWNLANSSTWAIDEYSVNEIGCIHTCQGLEFDYIGVIIGDDLRFENDQLVTDFKSRAKTDQSLKGIKKLYKEDKEQALNVADKIIKNTYRTLLTRGQKGCYIYCTNENLCNYLKKSIHNFKTSN